MFLNVLLNFIFPENDEQKSVNSILERHTDLSAEISTTRGPYPTYSIFRYRNPIVRALIWQLKYLGNKKVAAFFGRKIFELIVPKLKGLSGPESNKIPVLIPIPISRKKRLLRGFNQSELIAQEVAKLDKNTTMEYCPYVLYKIKDTKSQARLKDKADRLKNLKDSFYVIDSANVTGRTVIMMDDVITTGSTLREASRTLESSGAAKIIWVTIAR